MEQKKKQHELWNLIFYLSLKNKTGDPSVKAVGNDYKYNDVRPKNPKEQPFRVVEASDKKLTPRSALSLSVANENIFVFFVIAPTKFHDMMINIFSSIRIR